MTLPKSRVLGVRLTDANGDPLGGSTRYSITFDFDNLSPVTEFRSIPIHDAQGYFVENELDRYSINGFLLEEGLLHAEDDELAVYVQREKPDGPEKMKNQLPVPGGGMRFAARFSGPYWSLVDDSYDMPEVVPARDATSRFISNRIVGLLSISSILAVLFWWSSGGSNFPRF